MNDVPPAGYIAPGMMCALGATIDSRMYPAASSASPVYSPEAINSSARDAMPARLGPARLTPGVVEWHARQAGVAFLKTFSPAAIGSTSGETGRVGTAVTPGCSAAPGAASPVATRIGLGGQPCVSTLLAQLRNAIRSAIS